MEYIELKCKLNRSNDNNSEQLMAVLGVLGFESFVEGENELLAYMPSKDFDPAILDNEMLNPEVIGQVNFTWSVIADQNWNAVWEENFQPVTIDNRCHIRAPFHPENKEVEYEIVIEPKMSFGTAHHETTAMMIKYLLEIDLKDKMVLDMGCGTGVLAILATMKEANRIIAIDNDEWAYKNANENIRRNNTPGIDVYLGDASLLKDQVFNVIIANINRNILLNDIPVYNQCLMTNGLLLLSGFYMEDLPKIEEAAVSLGLVYVSHKEENNWVAACFRKK
jgi:ribosomal protein L11 methyltransferase